jgi:hypothetical protein
MPVKRGDRQICRRSFLLLEVLIALTVVSLAILPLLYPHFKIYQQQKAFTHKLEMDLAAPRIYAAIVQKLHQNEILFGDIEQRTSFPIDTGFLEALQLTRKFPFRGKYQLAIEKQKKNEQYGLYLLTLQLEMFPHDKQQKPLTYSYQIFVSRLFSGDTAEKAAPTKAGRN